MTFILNIIRVKQTSRQASALMEMSELCKPWAKSLAPGWYIRSIMTKGRITLRKRRPDASPVYAVDRPRCTLGILEGQQAEKDTRLTDLSCTTWSTRSMCDSLTTLQAHALPHEETAISPLKALLLPSSAFNRGTKIIHPRLWCW